MLSLTPVKVGVISLELRIFHLQEWLGSVPTWVLLCTALSDCTRSMAKENHFRRLTSRYQNASCKDAITVWDVERKHSLVAIAQNQLLGSIFSSANLVM